MMGLCLTDWAERGCGRVSVRLSSQAVIGQDEMGSSCVKGGLDWILGRISSLKELTALEQAAWGSG